jgi:predicted dehydrogenase
MRPVHIAVVGGGRLGCIHARLAQSLPELHLVAVVEPSAPRREQLSRELDVPVVEHHHEIWHAIDAAIVAAPTCLHHSVAFDLLRQGIHVLVEKPLTQSGSEARDLVALADRQQLVLQVGHVERFNPAFQAALPHLHSPYYLEATRTSGYTCRSVDVGVVLDLMIHDLDIVLSLVSSPLVDIQAVGTPVFGPHEDMAQTRLTFANGCVANLTASRTSDQPCRRLHVYQREAYARIDFAEKRAELISVSDQVLAGIDVEELDESDREQIRTHLFHEYLPRTELVVNDQNAILNEQRDFATSICTGRAPRVTGREACRAVEVAEQIQERIAAFQNRLRHPTLLPVPASLPPATGLLPPHRRQAG